MMKKILVTFIILFSICNGVFAQAETAKETKIKSQIIALEKAGWKAWKDKNVQWFADNTAPGFLSVSAAGISDKAQVLESTPTECDIKNFSLRDFKLVMLSDDVVVLTYIATQQGMCSGKKIPAKVRVSVNYVKRAGKWLEAYYMEAAMD